MARRFQVKSPLQLMMLEGFAKDGNLSRAASIWRITKEKKGDKGTSWDNRIVVDFWSVDGHRTATVFRLDVTNEKEGHKVFAHLRYNPALAWCKENLTEIK